MLAISIPPLVWLTTFQAKPDVQRRIWTKIQEQHHDDSRVRAYLAMFERAYEED